MLLFWLYLPICGDVGLRQTDGVAGALFDVHRDVRHVVRDSHRLLIRVHDDGCGKIIQPKE